MSKHGRILVAMSGGGDSSVAAVMLHEQGYEVIGLTMKTWDYASSGGSSKETGCCSLDSINDARALAVGYGFPHYILDIRSEFGDLVINNFVDEYLAGRTPNPCVLCNTQNTWVRGAACQIFINEIIDHQISKLAADIKYIMREAVTHS